MRLIKNSSLILFAIIACSITIYSCKSDPVTPPHEGFVWKLSDSLPGDYVDGMHTLDIYTYYAYNTSRCYKISNGIKSIVDFGDTNFSCFGIGSYSPTYSAFVGLTDGFPSRVTLKIINNGILSTTLLDSNPSSLLSKVIVLQPGKILFTFEQRLYSYNNGVTTVFRAENPDELFFRMVNTGGIIYAASFSGASENKTYKLENNILTKIETAPVGFDKLQTDYFLLKNTITSNSSSISYLTSSGWMPLCSDSVDQRFYEAAGEDVNLIYFLRQSNTSYDKGGSYWNGTALIRDENFPFKGNDSEFRIISNMKDRVFYVAKRVNNTTLIYQGYFPEDY